MAILIKTRSSYIYNFVLKESAELGLGNEVTCELGRPYRLRFATIGSLNQIRAGARLAISNSEKQMRNVFAARRERALEGFLRMTENKRLQ